MARLSRDGHNLQLLAALGLTMGGLPLGIGEVHPWTRHQELLLFRNTSIASGVTLRVLCAAVVRLSSP